MNHYVIWFKRVVWFGIVANFTFAFFAIVMPTKLLTALNLGSVESTIWLLNYSVLLTLLSCFYIPAAHNPYRYIVNSWLLVAARLIPATTFFIGVLTAYMPKGFLTLGIGDFTIGCIEAILLMLTLRSESSVEVQQVKVS